MTEPGDTCNPSDKGGSFGKTQLLRSQGKTSTTRLHDHLKQGRSHPFFQGRWQGIHLQSCLPIWTPRHSQGSRLLSLGLNHLPLQQFPLHQPTFHPSLILLPKFLPLLLRLVAIQPALGEAKALTVSTQTQPRRLTLPLLPSPGHPSSPRSPCLQP